MNSEMQEVGFALKFTMVFVEQKTPLEKKN